MGWVYEETKDGTNEKAMDKMLNFLNGLNVDQNNTVKLAASDRKDGDTRTLVVYLSDGKTGTPPMPNSTVWQNKVWQDKNLDTNYKDLVNFLNNELDEDTAYFSQITFDNHKDGHPHVILWHRK